MQTAKPTFLIDGDYSLPVKTALREIAPSTLNHEKYGCRHPLGIYNISLGRISRKALNCARRVDALSTHSNPNFNAVLNDALEELIDYIELTLYAAAEHVDDVELIAQCLFESSAAYKRDHRVLELKRRIKPVRDRLSAFANAIKHKHARVRLYFLEVLHGENRAPLWGFFLEACEAGVVCPSPILHSEIMLISVSAFLWSIASYLIRMSEELREFLTKFPSEAQSENQKETDNSLEELITTLCRLPLYWFDEDNPFAHLRFIVDEDRLPPASPDKTHYGSVYQPWTDSNQLGLGNWRMLYAGDGVTKSFSMISPQNLKIHRLSTTKDIVDAGKSTEQK